MNCNHECNSCASSCNASCPICNKTGLLVKLEAALNLVNNNSYIDKNKKVYICQNKKCTVTYFQEENPKYYTKEEVNVPIWFKEPMNEMIVCYCYNISLQEIIKVVKEHKVYTKDEVIKILNKPKNNDCLHSNPIGKECDRLFENAIAYAKGVE